MFNRRRRLTPLALLSALLMNVTAHAEWRCDCTKITDSCAATVGVEGNWVNVTSDHEQCSRVDYYIDGQPFVTVVVDGEDKQNWLSRTADLDTLVKSCQVCSDRLLDDDAGAADTPPATPMLGDQRPPTLAAVIKTAPVYPPEALARNVGGYVIVEFKVTPQGTVQNPRVVEARPEGV